MCAAAASFPTPSFSFSFDPPGSPPPQQQQQHRQLYDPAAPFVDATSTSSNPCDPQTMAGSVGWHADFFNPWTDPAAALTAQPGYPTEAVRPSTAPSLLPSRQGLRSSSRLQAIPRRLTSAGSSLDEELELRRASDLANAEASAESASLAGLTIARVPTKRRTASPDASEESGTEAIKSRMSAAEEEDPSRKKRSRTLTTPSQQARLLSVLQQTRFPSTELREELAIELGMTPRRVQIWFQNRRQGMKKAMDERAEAERAAAARHEAAVYIPEDTSRGYSFGAYPTPFIPTHQVQQPPPPPKMGRAPPGSAFLPPQNRMMPNNHAPIDYSTPRFEAVPFGHGFDARTVQMPAPPFDPRHQRRHTAPESVTWPQVPSTLVTTTNSPAFSFEAPLSTAPQAGFAGLGALAAAAGVRPTSSPAAPLSSTSTSTNINGPPEVDFAAQTFELFLSGAASLPPELLGLVDDPRAGSVDGQRPSTSAGPPVWGHANGLLM